MDDGSDAKSGFYLHTEGFTYNDCYKLAAILHYNFDIVVTIQDHNKQPIIYITAKSMPKFINLVYPHFHKSMLYKIEK
jgi:hypothetical protein